MEEKAKFWDSNTDQWLPRGWEWGAGLRQEVKEISGVGATLLCLHCDGGDMITYLEMYTKKCM